MTESEREMLREKMSRLQQGSAQAEERWTSLQPTYEDSVPPDADHDWALDD